MTLSSTLRLALRSIAANRLRSSLTMLGIVIGVGSVVLLVAAGHATSDAVGRKLDALGATVLMIYPGGEDDLAPVAGPDPVLTDVDVATVARVGVAGGVAEVAPTVSQSSVSVQTGVRSTSVQEVDGAPPALLRMNNVRYTAGTGYTDADERSRARVIVLGSKVGAQLFGKTAGVGDAVILNGVRFRVVGVLAPRGADDQMDTSAYVPLTAARDSLVGPSAPVATIAVRTTSRAATLTAQGPIGAALRAHHGLSGNQPNDFSMYDQASLLDTSDSIATVLRLVLLGVAATSLFVGGMGVMNIMLITVVERTREVGIRRAIGASHRQIVGQFLAEAIVLCLLGGLAGATLGVIVARVGGSLTGYAATVGLPSIAIALGVSALVGVLFGFYPANRAATLRPIDALRHE